VRSGASHLALRALAMRLSNGRARRVGTGFGGEVRKNRRDVVALSELVGMEFFDATILLDQVAAAVIKVDSK
jgi:hypothetical protein